MCVVAWLGHHATRSWRVSASSSATIWTPITSGAITLGCGIELALADLGIDFLDYEHLLTVCDLVDRQLAEQPWAELKCPQGTARIELVPR